MRNWPPTWNASRRGISADPPTGIRNSRPTRFPRRTCSSPWESRIRAKDPDRWDVLTYSWEGTPLPDATLDAKTGRFEWTPTKTGTFEATLKITDDGLPPRSTTKRFQIEVAEAPEGDALQGDLARPRQIGLCDRDHPDRGPPAGLGQSASREGRLLRLFEGSEFKVGDVTLTVGRIQDKAVEVEAKSLKMRWLVSLGQNVAEDDRLARGRGEPPAADESETSGEEPAVDEDTMADDQAAPEKPAVPDEKPAEKEGATAEEKPAPKEGQAGDEKPDGPSARNRHRETGCGEERRRRRRLVRRDSRHGGFLLAGFPAGDTLPIPPFGTTGR